MERGWNVCQYYDFRIYLAVQKGTQRAKIWPIQFQLHWEDYFIKIYRHVLADIIPLILAVLPMQQNKCLKSLTSGRSDVEVCLL